MSDERAGAPVVERPAFLETARSTVVCSCGWKASGRTPEASGDGWRDHVAYAHAFWASQTVDGRPKAIA